MRKNILLFLLSTFVLTLTACSKDESTSAAEASSYKSLADVSDETATMPEPGVDVVTDIVKVPLEDNGTFDPEVDCQAYLTLGSCAESKEGYYFYQNDHFLKFFDKAAKTIRIVCNKPNCTHDNANCNAYVDGYNDIFYYKGYLYTIGSFMSEYAAINAKPYQTNLNLVRISLDGTTKDYVKTLTSVYLEDSDFYIVTSDMIQHRGYIYYVYNMRAAKDKDIYSNGNNCLYRVAIEGNSEPEYLGPIERNSLEDPVSLVAYGNYVYVCDNSQKEFSNLFRYNISENKIELLSFDLTSFESFIDINGSIIYMKESFKSDVYLYDPVTNTSSTFIKLPDDQKKLSGSIKYDGTYYYIIWVDFDNDEWGFYIYDKSGIYINTIFLSPTIPFSSRQSSITGNIDYLMIFDNKNDFYYIDKSELSNSTIPIRKASE